MIDSTDGRLADANVGSSTIMYDGEYHRLNAELHPLVPPRIRAPALNWHLAAWSPVIDSAATMAETGDYSPEQWDWFNHIDTQIGRMVRRICNHGATVPCSKINVNGIELDEGPIPSAIRLLKHTINVTKNGSVFDISRSIEQISSDMHNRYGYELFTIRFIRLGIYYRIRLELHLEYLTLTIVAEIDTSKHSQENNKLVISLKRILVERSELNDDKVSASREELLASDSKYVYEGFWEETNQAYVAKFFESYASRGYRANVFADFRAAIVAPLPSADPAGEAARRFTLDQCREIADSAVPFMAATAPSSRPEFCASSFIGRRAVYLSSLGTRAPEGDNSPRPVKYLIITRGGRKWQLGRLIERLNTMGTYRLAALRDLKALNEASDGVQRIGVAIRGLSLDGVGSEKRLEEQHRNLYRKLNSLGKDATGGLAYRIERSRFYQGALMRLMPDLRSWRIEGFQPYDEFVRRRLSSTYDFIDRLGIRTERSRQRLDSLNSELRTTQQVEQTRAANRLQWNVSLISIFPVLYAIKQIFYGADLKFNEPKFAEDHEHYFALFCWLVVAGGLALLLWYHGTVVAKLDARGRQGVGVPRKR